MEVRVPQRINLNVTARSSNGCWICKVRRKKCDERRPFCGVCQTLSIACNYDKTKPEWMDNGVRQQEMVAQLKDQVRENAHIRRTRATRNVVASLGLEDPADPPHGNREINTGDTAFGAEAHSNAIPLERQESAGGCSIKPKGLYGSKDFGQSESVLLAFYLEHLLPFIFPFYQPSLLEGGKAWIIHLAMSSPGMRQALLCQSSYFFSLAQGTDDRGVLWDTTLTQTKDAFELLRQSIEVIYSSDINEHLHGAARIMASILQMQRFEVAVLSFGNCRAHLDVALILFGQLLGSAGPTEFVGSAVSFRRLMDRLGPSPCISSSQSVQVPSAEQAAFRFSSGLLIFDDIIASTVLQEQPKLYEHHRSLLDAVDGNEPIIDLQAIVGCQNYVLIQIGEVAALDAWKSQCKRDRNLDIMELVHRASAIKQSLKNYLKRLEDEPQAPSEKRDSFLSVFTKSPLHKAEPPSDYGAIPTRVWAHAALIYLSVVVSGWQPASADVRYNVGRILVLLVGGFSPPPLLRTLAWPFCLAGCFAEAAQQNHIRVTVQALQPPSVFGTIHKALEIMESIWRKQEAGDTANLDLAACFRHENDLVLLV